MTTIAAPTFASRAKVALKFLIVGALLAVLARRGLLSFDATASAFEKPALLLQGMPLTVAANFVAIARWRYLLIAQRINLPTRKVVDLALIGNFFNLALPGAVSGDVVKAVYIGRSARERRAHALSSILFDRVSGVTGLVLLASGALAYGHDLAANSRLMDAIETLLLTSGAGALAFFGYLVISSGGRDPLLRLLRKAQRRWPRAGSLVRVYEGIAAYGPRRATVAASIGASILVHGLNVTAFVIFNQALGVTEIDPLSLFVIVPAGMLVTAIPVLPGGIGTGHYAFAAFYGMLGSNHGADAFNLYLINQFLIGAVGGLVYLRGSYGKVS